MNKTEVSRAIKKIDTPNITINGTCDEFDIWYLIILQSLQNGSNSDTQ